MNSLKTLRAAARDVNSGTPEFRVAASDLYAQQMRLRGNRPANTYSGPAVPTQR